MKSHPSPASSPQSAKRRFLSGLFGVQPDRTPVGNVVSIATVELMKASGVWFPQAHLDAVAMASLAATGHTVLEYDTVMPVFSVVQEAAALGCDIDWGAADAMPTVRSHPWCEAERPSLPENWMEATAIQVVLEALRHLRQDLGHKVVVVGKVMGPWTLSYHMMGVEQFLICTKIAPERARRMLETLKEVTVAFAIAQMQSGADLICVADHITGGMVSPLVYRDMVLPIHQEIVSRIGCPTVLHCCGNTTDRVQYFAQAGFDCYHLESQVNLASATADAAGHMTLMGNINNPDVLLKSNPDAVAQACHHALDGGIQLLAPECAVPLTTPISNLRVLVEVAESRKTN